MSELRFFVGDMNFCLEGKGDGVRGQLAKIEAINKEKRLTPEELAKLLAPLLQKDEKALTYHGHLSSY